MSEPRDASFVDAVVGQRLSRTATEILDDESKAEQHDDARAAIATCTTIATQVADLQEMLVGWSTERGHTVLARPVDSARQHHTMSLRTVDVDAAEAVRYDLIEALGFEPWETWSGGALESFRRNASHFTVARTAAQTEVVRVEWRDAPRRTSVQRAIVPTAGDWHAVGLPRWAWWAYSLVRPARLVAERLGLRRRHDGSLGPYLSTPVSLVDPLFDFAAISSDDVVADVGCGDGRLVIAAAQRFGCRTIGVEYSADLAARARQTAASAGVEHLVQIVHGDARTADLADATVILMFLPVDVAADLLDATLAKLPIGGRLVVHEQRGLPASMTATSPPDVSRMLLGADGVTVAHRWTR